MNTNYLFNFLLTQRGNYNELADRTDYNILGPNYRDGIAVLVVTEINNSGDYTLYDREEWPLLIPNIFGAEYHYFIYAVVKWLASGSYNQGDIVWYDDGNGNLNAWVSKQNGNTQIPAEGSYWTALDNDLSQLDSYTPPDPRLKADFYYRPVTSSTLDMFTLNKTAPHSFSLYFNSSSELIDEISLFDFLGNLITTIDIEPDAGDCTFTTSEDNVYFLVVTTDQGNQYIVNVYDLSDIEACYSDLVDNVLCECVDCNNCPGDKYYRALNFVNLYTTIRDLIYSDSFVNYGLIETGHVRSDWLNKLGVIVTKLKLLANDCTCNN